jgi:long-chain acyl-CoA synthetase
MPQDLTVLDLLENSVKRAPKSIAIALPDGAISYEELAERSKRVASALIKENFGKVAALFFPTSPEFIVAYLGALYAGKQALPLNLLLPPEELKYILTDSNSERIIVPAALAPKLEPLGVKLCRFEDLAANAPSATFPKAAPEEICTLLYTSGTTGKPKGVELTHHNLASNAASSVDAMRLESSSRFLACLPTFHTFAITGTTLAPIAAGASIATLPRFDPEGVLKVASGLKCDTLVMVPSMYRLVTRMQERRPQEMSHLRLAIAGGEALPEEVRNQFEKVFAVKLLEGYGQTESGPVVSFNMPWANKPGTVGKPIKDVKVKIVDPETMTDQPASTTGEIWVSGPNVMKGYHNRPEETAKALTKDGWLRTGDMGELTPDGYIRITGRLREMIKVAGEMVFPAEVEEALHSHPAVSEAGVAGVKDERKGEIVKAFVVLKETEKATEDQLLQHCRNVLAAYKVPKVIEFRKELPKGPTGKVLRRLLK